MNLDHRSGRFAAIVFCLAFLIVFSAAVVAQDTEPNMVAGTGVSADTQRSLGLVTVNGGCSGTLLNRHWVLTARHCVTVDNRVSTELLSHNRVQISAAWTAQTAVVSRIYDFDINSAAGSARDRDIVLLYLGGTNLGEVAEQKRFVVNRDGKISGRLITTDTVTQYGRGFSTFATDMRTPSAGLGVYRSAVFTPSGITTTHYNFNMNTGNQVGQGGDSGGPSFVTHYGRPNGGIAGVQSTCNATGHVPGSPGGWTWATGISLCTYVSTEPFLSEISKVIKEAPPVPPFIVAGQPIATTLTTGSVYLGWDGGPDHPNAEVWVAVHKQGEVPAFEGNFGIHVGVQNGVFKLPKVAAIELRLERLKQYKFVLKSAGKTLSTATFFVP